MAEFESYEDELRKTKSLVIVAALQKQRDTKAVQEIEAFSAPLDWEPPDRFLSVRQRGNMSKKLGIEPKFVSSAIQSCFAKNRSLRSIIVA
jgi:hypothetical protein